MNHEEKDLQAFVSDYERDFGVVVPPEDADRILTLYDELCFLFDKYSPEEGFSPWFYFG